MSVQPNVDNSEGNGAGGEATSSASAPTGKPVEGTAEELSKLVKSVIAEELKPIKGEISGLYSRQDKDRNQLREFMDEFKKVKAEGKTDEEAEVIAQRNIAEREKQSKRDQVIDALAERFLGTPSTPSAGNGASGAVNPAQEIAKKYNLDMNDKDYADAVKSGDPAKLLDVVMAKTSAPSADETSHLPLGGGSYRPPENADELSAELDRLYREPSRPGAMKRITEIEKQLKGA